MKTVSHQAILDALHVGLDITVVNDADYDTYTVIGTDTSIGVKYFRSNTNPEAAVLSITDEHCDYMSTIFS